MGNGHVECQLRTVDFSDEIKDNGFGFPELAFSFLCGCWFCYEILVVDLI